MSLVINTNPSATTAAVNLRHNNRMLQTSLDRLSSGKKIVSPADDAGGMAVSMKLVAAQKRTDAVNTNLQNAISFLQSQDGALVSAGKLLNRMSELKMMAADVTKNDEDITNYNREFEQLRSQLINLQSEKFNNVPFFGTMGDEQVISTEDGNLAQAVDVSHYDLGGTGTAVETLLNRKLDAAIDTAAEGPNTFAFTDVLSVSEITAAIQEVATYRATNGAQTSRLNHASEILTINKINLEAANSRIMDTDIAAESTRLAKYNILTQSGASMLAQANQIQSIALQLLQ